MPCILKNFYLPIDKLKIYVIIYIEIKKGGYEMENIEKQAYEAIEKIVCICEKERDCDLCPFYYEREDICMFSGSMAGCPSDWHLNKPIEPYYVLL